MRVGIVIGTYNNLLHVTDTIKSVQSQTFKEWLCVIVDNGSSDDTVSKIKSVINGDDKFKFYPKKNEGPSIGRNYGYSLLPNNLDYIHFLDGDDQLKPDFLEKMVSYLDKNDNVGLLGCQFEIIDENGKYLGPGYRSRIAPNALGFPKSLLESEFNTPFETFFSATGQGPFALFRNDIFKLTTGYEEEFWSHEDSDIFCQMSLLSQVHYLPERLYVKRTHSNNLTASPKASYKKFRAKWDLYTSKDEIVNEKIVKALRYYYGFHVPVRHFKVFIKATKTFTKHRERSRFKWMMELLKDGFNELVFKSALKRKLLQRNSKNLGVEIG
jgi:glycosyltransferase involved in cell wall biosynthesis